ERAGLGLLGRLVLETLVFGLRIGEVRVFLVRLLQDRLGPLYIAQGIEHLRGEEDAAAESGLQLQGLLDVRQALFRLAGAPEDGHAEIGMELRLGMIEG